MQELQQQAKLHSIQGVEQQTCEICCVVAEKVISLFETSIICYDCWHQHIRAAVTRISYQTGSQIISPFEGKMPVDVCVALGTLENGHSSELEEWLFKKYSSFTTDIQKCPSQNCDYVFMMEKCKWKVNIDEKCPKCQAVLVQSATLNLKGIIGFIYFLFLTNKCPKCQIPIEKTTGCPHMTCPCGHQFCWFCLKDHYASGNNVYSVHEPRQCAFIFISKILFMTMCLSGIVLTFLGNDIFHQCVGYFFVGIKYMLLTFVVDLILIGNFLLINHIVQKIRNQRMYGYDNRMPSVKYFIGALIVVDIVLLLVFYLLEMYTLIFWVIIAQVALAAFVALNVWLVVYSVETWFDYIG